MAYHPKPTPTPLEQSPAARGYPRSAKGEYGHWQNGSYFSTSQQEFHKLGGRCAGGDAQFGIIELENGEWLAGGCIRGARYPDRQAALAAAATECIRTVTSAAKPYTNGRTYPARLDVWFANTIIQWAANEAGIPAPLMAEPAPRPLPQLASDAARAAHQLDLFGA
jgi:hypothetical protein